MKLARALDLADPRGIPDHGYAGGVIIDSDGFVLTPHHVIDGATKVYVHLPGGAGSYADIHAADARSDLAVLKLINPPETLKPIRYAEVRTFDRGANHATVATGKLAVLMTFPYSSNFRFDNPSAAFGAITNVHKRLVHPDPTKGATTSEKLASHYKSGTLLEHDIKVNGSDRRGALVDLDGKLIGLTTAAAVVFDREPGPGYGSRLMTTSAPRERPSPGEEIEYGFLGVQLPNDTTSAIRLLEITDNGPAEAAGLRVGDVVTHINGSPVASFDDLMLHIGCALAGSNVKLNVVRDRVRHEIVVTLGKFRNDQPYIASVRPEPVFGMRVDYPTTRTIPIGNRKRGPMAEQGIPNAVWVRDVIADSPAAGRFKSLGDRPEDWMVTKVNGTTISSPGEFYRAAKGQEKVKLTLRYLSDPGRERELTLP